MERPLSVLGWRAPTSREVVQLVPLKENYAQKAHVLDAAVLCALQRIAGFSFGLLLGNIYEAAYGHVRGCNDSAAQCWDAACTSSRV